MTSNYDDRIHDPRLGYLDTETLYKYVLARRAASCLASPEALTCFPTPVSGTRAKSQSTVGSASTFRG